MTRAELQALTNDRLVDLGAELEQEAEKLRLELDNLVFDLNSGRKEQIKPGLKLAINAGLAVAGILLAPITVSWSLFVTVAGLVMIGLDLNAFGSEAQKIVVKRQRASLLRRRAAAVNAALQEIDRLLTERLGNP